MSFLLRLGPTLCAALLAACTTPPLQSTAETAPAFELAGRIAVRYPDRAFSSALRWKQDAGSDEIWLTAPLGQTIAYLLADASGATLTTPDQKQYRARSIESLTRSALGWSFPVAGMRYWVRGQPAPGMALSAVERSDDSRFARFRQDDWKITFNYASSGATPSRLDIVGSDAEIRFVIDSWTPAQP
jgi:outer membrane lipoprotein LolB